MNLTGLLETDTRLSSRLRLPGQNGALWRAAVFFAHSGDSWFWLAGLALVALLTHSAGRTLAIVMALGVIGLAVFVLAIKFTVRRQRPEGEWGAVYRNRDPHSFPSGHAARAALLAVLAWGLGPLWLAVLLSVWAPLVSLARVATGVHYLSDVVAGLLIGLLAGWGLLALAPWLLAWVGIVI